MAARSKDDWKPEVVYRPVDDLIPYIGNAKLHTSKQVDMIAGSIKEFGFVSPVLIDSKNGIVAGHGRLLALKKLGHDSVPCICVDHLSDAQIKALRIADNKLAEGKWDPEVLSVELLELSEDGFDLSIAGFPTWRETEDEAGSDPETSLPRTEVLQAKWKTEVGQLWEIGQHKLAIGDSTELGTYSMLGMELDKIALVVTDPPYGVDYVGGTKDKLTIKNDSVDNLGDMLDGFVSITNSLCLPGAPWYVCVPAGPKFIHFAEVLLRHEIWRQTLVWVKDTLVMGGSDYHYRHEEMLYGWTPGTHTPPPNRKQDTVWEIDRPKVSREHPTMKPVRLFAKAVQNSSVPGDLVFDPFAGSGTLFLAADETDRRCNGIELDPCYAAVILERMEERGHKPEPSNGK